MSEKDFEEIKSGKNTDRRVLKTRKAIIRAFYSLLSKKKYDDITIQNIIDEADIGRSTFYAHFETKDELLHSMCRELFEHVFSDEFTKESLHNIAENQNTLRYRIFHICAHLYENRNEIVRIMRFDSSIIFKQYLSEYLTRLFEDRLHELDMAAPEDFVMKQLADSFISALEWWTKEEMNTRPSDIAGYYCDLHQF